MIREARGLDVTWTIINRLWAVANTETAAAFTIIMNDEIGHVAIGKKWFDYVCGMGRCDPASTRHQLVTTYFPGLLKPLFNIWVRTAVDFSAAFHAPLAERTDPYDRPRD